MKNYRIAMLAIAMAAGLSACQTPNSVAMRIGAGPESAVKLRALETRRYDTQDHAAMLGAGVQTLQDLGFTLTESSSDVGVLIAAKERDAEETGQVVAQVALTVALALLGSYHNPDWDKDQTITVTFVAVPVADSQQTDVRVTFNRHVRTKNGARKSERIDQVEIYQQFFEKFSGALFLEGREI